MESLGHFVFEIIKIVILSFCYSVLLKFLLSKLVTNNSNYIFEKIVNPKRRLWFYLFIFLLIFMCTNIGSHGLGDSANIPISLTKSIDNVNWEDGGTLNDVIIDGNDRIETTKWIVKNGKLCGNLLGFNDYKNSYFVYEISSNIVTEFKTSIEYEDFAKINRLPNIDEFKSFAENYDDYWRGWRFWLLP